MTLQEKFYKVMVYPFSEYKEQMKVLKEENSSEYEKIADEFAIEFSEWKEDNAVSDGNGLYYGESRIGVSRENPVDIHQLLEIYKEQNKL